MTPPAFLLPIEFDLAAISTTLLRRLLAIRFNWSTVPVHEWDRQLLKYRAKGPEPTPTSGNGESNKNGD